MVAAALLMMTTRTTSAAAAPVTQCNDDTDSNVGGQGIACSVTVVNYLTSTGTLDGTLPSTVTVTRCVGAAGPISQGAGTCTTTTTTSAEPVTQVRQCNGSANGGGGVMFCSVTITNHFVTSPATAPSPATVYQCVGSEITGPGAPAICTPENTPGVTSVGAATVGQCNGSGNGGTSVGFICTVAGGSTTTVELPLNIDQCNDSANGGGSLVNCSATVTNDVLPASTGTPTSPAGSPTASPTVTQTPGPGTPTVTPPPGTGTPASPAGSPTGSASPTPAATTSATPSPGATPVIPGPPSTGTGTVPGDTTRAGWMMLSLSLVVAAALVLGIVRRRAATGPKGPRR